MADMKKEYDNLIIINLYISSVIRPWCTTTYAEGSGAEKFINFCLVWCDVASRGQEIPKGHYGVYNSPKIQRKEIPNFCPSI